MKTFTVPKTLTAEMIDATSAVQLPDPAKKPATYCNRVQELWDKACQAYELSVARDITRPTTKPRLDHHLLSQLIQGPEFLLPGFLKHVSIVDVMPRPALETIPLGIDWDKGEERIDNIGPNGNEGEHYEVIGSLRRLSHEAPVWADELYQPEQSQVVYARNVSGRSEPLSSQLPARVHDAKYQLPPVCRLRCVDNSDLCGELTMGQVYSTRSEGEVIVVCNDNGEPHRYHANRFEELY